MSVPATAIWSITLALGLSGGLVGAGSSTAPAAAATDDVVSVNAATSVNTIVATTCAGRLSGGAGDDTLAATKGVCTLPRKARVITFEGGAGADLVGGSRHRNRIFGGRGSDRLFGDAGNDLVVGGKGRDKADGGLGRDTCRTEKRTFCELR